ncbi:Beta-eudesmol synthase [Platanthera zijinensis]|uniref:Beta-eudesmol synthase n=1 Tax=Platanthera zijinensis TaxID=2320716 RepID=A0AAP0BN97_9ASPA
MLKDTATDQLLSLEMIDEIQHLGVAYHFELEIDEALERIQNTDFHLNNDPHTIALGFRLLRQHRFPISSDIFNKFIDQNGDLADNLKQDAKALLSIYNACFLGIPGEKLLEKAANFTRTHLKLLIGSIEPSTATTISRALETPRFRWMERLEAREYLQVYGHEKNRNEKLFEFAKLDFHLVQSIHLEELHNLTLWKNSIKFMENFSFARERMVELHFWMIGIYHEQGYSRARVMATKLLVLTSILDDIYDQYGTEEELQMLTNTIDRWDLMGVDLLPKYLHHFFTILYRTFQEFEDELALEQNSFRVGYLKEEMKKLAHAYFVEVQWGNEQFVPNIEDHLRISLRSSVYPMIVCGSFIGMNEMIPQSVFDWITKFPQIVKSASFIGRVMNDITSDEHEQMDKHFASIIKSYTKEYKCIEEEARKNLMELVEDAWKILNEEYLLHSNLPIFLVQPIMNLARVTELFYKDKDNYTNPFSSMRDIIKLVIVEPIISKWTSYAII